MNRSQSARQAWHTRRIKELEGIKNHMPPGFLKEIFGTEDVYEIISQFENMERRKNEFY